MVGAVTEFLSFLAAREGGREAGREGGTEGDHRTQGGRTARPHSEEVFWAWRSPLLPIYGLIRALHKPQHFLLLYDQVLN